MSDCAFPLISEKYDISSILEESKDGLYQQKLQNLGHRYVAIRKTKGDGNCFYRALGFSYLEAIIGNPREISRFKEIVLQSKDELTSAGFQDHQFTNVFQTFFSVIESVETDGSVSSLLKTFNDEICSDSIVQYFRLLTSAFLKNRAEFYQEFVEDGLNINDFCTQEVEAMAMECDHLQILALSQALAVPLQVEYVDDTDADVNYYTFPEATSPLVYMLFMRQHYNILYCAS